ncbi:MAG: hypothetical protein GY791_20545 [Alphaproteobacteria bacterium]|nr:hypothetical protein [Alphaproteobacteria bacterium]
MLYMAAVGQARRGTFYRSGGVPDTLDGRFDMIALHVFLILHRLRSAHGRGKLVGQALFDTMFADMDENLRELGVGDLAVGRRVKTMAKALYGRIAAYQAALGSPRADDLAAALSRNLYRGIAPDDAVVAIMADYVRFQAAHLADLGDGDILDGSAEFARFRDLDADPEI